MSNFPRSAFTVAAILLMLLACIFESQIEHDPIARIFVNHDIGLAMVMGLFAIAWRPK